MKRMVTEFLLHGGEQDFAYPKTTGHRPADMEESARYFAALDSLVGEDIQVHRLVSDVFNLAKPLSDPDEDAF